MILEGSTHLKEGVDFDFAIGKVAGSAWWSLNGYQHEGQPANGPVFKAEGWRSEFGVLLMTLILMAVISHHKHTS